MSEHTVDELVALARGRADGRIEHRAEIARDRQRGLPTSPTGWFDVSVYGWDTSMFEGETPESIAREALSYFTENNFRFMFGDNDELPDRSFDDLAVEAVTQTIIDDSRS